jgi:hypothetical protein
MGEEGHGKEDEVEVSPIFREKISPCLGLYVTVGEHCIQTEDICFEP